MKIFLTNLETISLHNRAFDDGNFTFKMGINEMTDMSFDELLKVHGVELAAVFVPFRPLAFVVDDFEVPVDFDWRSRGAVTRVRDQKRCGACYAFTAISALESQIFIKTGNLTELSVQEVLDCAEDYQTWGCGGGFDFRVVDFISDKGGVSTEADYPFTGSSQDSSCRAASYDKVSIDVVGYVAVPSNNKLIKQALVKHGPIMTSITISDDSFLRYSSGVFSQRSSELELSRHALLLVGYGKENGTEFWLAKNSYGESWGELGYVKIAKNCDIDADLLFPVIE